MSDKPEESLEWALLKRGLSQAVDEAAARLAKAADGTLDSLEKRLLSREVPEGEGLDQVRRHYGVDPGKEIPVAAEDPLARVRAELAALKKAQAEKVEPQKTPEAPKESGLSPAEVRARAELEAMKAARKAPTNPVKRTL